MVSDSNNDIHSKRMGDFKLKVHLHKAIEINSFKRLLLKLIIFVGRLLTIILVRTYENTPAN